MCKEEMTRGSSIKFTVCPGVVLSVPGTAEIIMKLSPCKSSNKLLRL